MHSGVASAEPNATEAEAVTHAPQQQLVAVTEMRWLPISRLSLLDPESERIIKLAIPPAYSLVRVCRHEPTIWLTDSATHRSVFRYAIASSNIYHLLDVSCNVAGRIADISHDGSRVCVIHNEQGVKHAIPTVRDAPTLWRYLHRPRRGWMSAIDSRSGRFTPLLSTESVCIDHVEFHPTDPTPIRYCHDVYEAHGQRMWSVRTDGSRDKTGSHSKIAADPAHLLSSAGVS